MTETGQQFAKLCKHSAIHTNLFLHFKQFLEIHV